MLALLWNRNGLLGNISTLGAQWTVWFSCLVHQSPSFSVCGPEGMALEALFGRLVAAAYSPWTESEVWVEKSKVYVEIYVASELSVKAESFPWAGTAFLWK